MASPPVRLAQLPSPLFDFAALARPPASLAAGPLPAGRAPSATSIRTTAATPSCAGPQWFGMQAPVMTPEVERDLRVLRLRSWANPKKHFKADDFVSKDRKHRLPTVFQLGTVVAGGMGEPALTRRQRRKNIALELLADDATRQYASRVFKSVQTAKASGGKKSMIRKQNKRTRFGKSKVIG